MNKFEVQAEKLLKSLKLFTAPVDVYAVAEKLGISVEDHEFDSDVSGVLMVRPNGAVIGVNQSHHPNRKRFTIAHEIAHFKLHREESKLFVDGKANFFRDALSSEGIDPQERSANQFAAALLMPAELVYRYYAEQQPDIYDPTDCARFAAKFRVSEQALIIRLTNLGLVDG